MNIKYLSSLAALFGEHHKISHWAVSYRIFKHGDFFQRLREGRSCQLNTAEKTVNWFSENWPKDLEWPHDIPRPKSDGEKP